MADNPRGARPSKRSTTGKPPRTAKAKPATRPAPRPAAKSARPEERRGSAPKRPALPKPRHKKLAPFNPPQKRRPGAPQRRARDDFELPEGPDEIGGLPLLQIRTKPPSRPAAGQAPEPGPRKQTISEAAKTPNRDERQEKRRPSSPRPGNEHDSPRNHTPRREADAGRDRKPSATGDRRPQQARPVEVGRAHV